MVTVALAVRSIEMIQNRVDLPKSPMVATLSFDDGAKDLWSLYEKEAKKDDEALIKPLKDDMDGVLIFVCGCLFWSTRADVTFPSRLAYFLVFSPHSLSHRFRICE